jgi:spore germination cell wall hydrolase CwlJ-like protein
LVFSFEALAKRRALIVAALTGATLGMSSVAAWATLGHGPTAPGTVRVPIAPAVAVDPVRAAADVHDHQRLLAAYDLRDRADPKEGAPAPFVSAQSRDLDCLTQAVYFEARGETQAGQAAVAQVVLNRVRHPAFPKTVCGVVYQGAASSHGCQFSFACDGSVRRGKEASAWARAHRVAARALAGAVMPEVGAATHFHAVAVSPGWGPGLQRVGQVGLHVFYRLSGGRGRYAPPRPEQRPAEPVILTALPAADAGVPAVAVEPAVDAAPAVQSTSATPPAAAPGVSLASF